MVKAPVPDPSVRPVPSAELEKDTPFPDDGPLVESGPAEIDIERGTAQGASPSEPPSPSAAQLPPD